MIYCFDLDETLCTTTGIAFEGLSRHEKYKLATPVYKMIRLVNKLYDQENDIIIHTARGMVTNRFVVKDVEKDIGAITKQWLERHKVQYHKLIFGKPFAHFYIDDKAVNVKDLLEEKYEI